MRKNQPRARIWRTILCNDATGKNEIVYSLNPMQRSEVPVGYAKQAETADDYCLPEGYAVQTIRGESKITDMRHAECKISDGYYVSQPAFIPPAWQTNGMAYPLMKIK